MDISIVSWWLMSEILTIWSTLAMMVGPFKSLFRGYFFLNFTNILFVCYLLIWWFLAAWFITDKELFLRRKNTW